MSVDTNLIEMRLSQEVLQSCSIDEVQASEKLPSDSEMSKTQSAEDRLTKFGLEHSDSAVVVPSYLQRKAWIVRLLGMMLLVPAAPVIGLLLLLVRTTSYGPGLFSQLRVGKGGREFWMYKIRTMYADAEANSGPVWCQPADSRVTPIGRLLRFLHLDELPQLWNIARGEMDLIGPRPERPEIITRLVEEIPNYGQRLTVLPGVTGLAQINLPPDETTDCVRRKLVLDLEYISIASWSVDLRILLCTLLRMIGIRHGRAVRLLRLEYQVSEVMAPELACPPLKGWHVPEVVTVYSDLQVEENLQKEKLPDKAGKALECKEFEADVQLENDDLVTPSSSVVRAHPK